MALNRPSLLHSQKEAWIAYAVEKSYDSIFSIEVIQMLKQRGQNNLENIKGRLSPEPRGPSSEVTGFAVSRVNDVISIVTCAHGFDQAFSEAKEVTTGYLNKHFKFKVRCIHQKDEKGQVAKVKAVDCRKDLLLLELKTTCKHDHLCLSMGSPPELSDSVILQGWPPRRPKSVAFGTITCIERSYSNLTRDNVKGYNMDLMELTDLPCANGFSGGPLINGELRCVGVYHGAQRFCGYAVSYDNVKSFINSQENAPGKRKSSTAVRQSENTPGKRRKPTTEEH